MKKLVATTSVIIVLGTLFVRSSAVKKNQKDNRSTTAKASLVNFPSALTAEIQKQVPSQSQIKDLSKIQNVVIKMRLIDGAMDDLLKKRTTLSTQLAKVTPEKLQDSTVQEALIELTRVDQAILQLSEQMMALMKEARNV